LVRAVEGWRAPGFKTSRGPIYLETHHAIPLSLGGADTPDNVIALCPNHHREAHHGARKDEIYNEAMRCIASAESRDDDG
jgi:predicted HNH restriction endonuclease